MTFAECQQRVSATEFMYWVAYERIEPFASDKNDYMLAQLCSMQANASRDSRKRPRPFAAHEFLPNWSAAADMDIADANRRKALQMQSTLRTFAKLHNIKIIVAEG